MFTGHPRVVTGTGDPGLDAGQVFIGWLAEKDHVQISWGRFKPTPNCNDVIGAEKAVTCQNA